MCTSKVLTNLCLTKQETLNQKYFCRYCLLCFSSEKILVEHKEICLKINDKQTGKWKSCFVEFKKYSRKIPAPFKILNSNININHCVESVKILNSKILEILTYSTQWSSTCSWETQSDLWYVVKLLQKKYQ